MYHGMIACGPVDAHTLAANATARVYVSRDHAVGCVHGRSRDLGPRGNVLLAGRRVAIWQPTELRVYDLGGRARTQRVTVTDAIIKVRLDPRGVAVAATDRSVFATRGGFNRTVPGLVPGSLAFRGGVIVWRDAVGIHPVQLLATDPKPRRLLRSGDVTLLVTDGTLWAQRGSSPARRLGIAAYDCPSAQGCKGYDLIQLAGPFAAARLIAVGPDVNTSWISVVNLASGRRRSLCRHGVADPSQLGGFQLAPDGSVKC
jgi:hypothetical protein